MSVPASLFLRALGTEADHLSAGLRAELRAEHGAELGAEPERGVGVFDTAGTPSRVLGALLWLVTAGGTPLRPRQHGVPFDVRTLLVTRDGRDRLETTRVFHFARGARRLTDALVLGRTPGTLVNLVGPGERLEILLACSVTAEGALRLRSRAARIRIGRKRFRLPRRLSVHVDVTDGWDPRRARRTIDVAVSTPLLGLVLRYAGWFRRDAPAPV